MEDIVGKTVVIHSDPDDFHSQPAGNPADKLTLPKKKRYRGAAYTVEQVKKLLAAVPEEDAFRPVILLALFYGLRRSEILGLTWNDFDFDARTIHVKTPSPR